MVQMVKPAARKKPSICCILRILNYGFIGAESREGRVIETSVFFIQNTRSAGNALIEGAMDYFATGQTLTFDSLPIFKYGQFGDRHFGWNDFLEDTKQRKRRFYAGHFVFGAQQHVPGPTKVAASIRETRPRLISGVRAWGGDVAKRINWIKSHWETDNGITKRLAGIGVLDGSAYDFVEDESLCPEAEFRTGPETFERAQRNLEKGIDAIILQERFSDSLVMAERALGLPPMVSFLKAHYNPSPPMDDPLPNDVLAEIDELNGFDRKIYALASEILEQSMANVPPEVERTLEARRAIDAMLHVPGGNVLTAEAAAEGIGKGLNGLLAEERKETVLEIVRIFIQHPVGQALFLDSLLGVAGKIATEAEMKVIREAQANPHSFGG